MSERAPQGHEKQPVPQHSGEHIKAHHERELSHAEKQHGSQEHVNKIAESIEKQAVSKEAHHSTQETQRASHPAVISRELKNVAFSRSMTRVRKRLSAPSRVFSRFIHNNVVDAVSETVGSTVARPSAMLGGSALSLVGLLGFSWITRHYGYAYNFTVATLLFVVGLFAGLIIELIVRKTFGKHQS